MSKPRVIPSIEQLLQRDAVRALVTTYGRPATVKALREATDKLRTELAGPNSADRVSIKVSEVGRRLECDTGTLLECAFAPSLRPIINATGVIVHTNLGRAPLAVSAITAIAAIAPGFTNLEYDLNSGGRGRRDTHVDHWLRELTGAEAAIVVNNNAAATLLVLTALASGHEVIVSRGELVEIGGGFRIPDVLAQSGACLREVGTTNRTRATDYASAINNRTGLLLRVHPSNFRIEGFAERPSLESLVAVGQQFGVPVVEDLGSGHLMSHDELSTEPTVRSSIETGVDVVCFSGDKLLGGPQAGILLGTDGAIDAMRINPLARALRLDKMSLAALDWTLTAYLEGRAESEIPVVGQLLASPEDLERRARLLAERVAERVKDGARVDVEADSAPVGGGSLPGFELETWVVSLRSPRGAARMAAGLRAAATPVLTRIRDDAVLFDLRTVRDADVASIEAAVAEISV